MSSLVATLAVAVILFGPAIVAAWYVGAIGSLSSGRYCPHCGNKALSVRHNALRTPLGRTLVRRWCPNCRWEGFRRRHAPSPRPTSTDVTKDEADKSSERPLLWPDPGPSEEGGGA